MKIMIFLSLFSFFQKTPESGIVKINDFGSNPGNLEMFQYVPEGLEKNAPLVIVLHGCAQSADTIAVESGWNKLADENKFMVVYPQQKLINNFKKCFNWFNPSDIKRDSGETASIKQMIDFAIKQHKINPKKVFITGLSGGAAMTSVMLANYPEIFNAGSLMAGIPFGATSSIKDGLNAMKGNIVKTEKEWSDFILEINKNHKGSYPKMAVFHGVDDPYVNIINANEIIKQYKGLHKIEKEVEIIDAFNNNPDVTLERYENEQIIYYKIKNMGHAIAINPGEEKNKGGKVSTYAIDKNFHSPYWSAIFFDIIK